MRKDKERLLDVKEAIERIEKYSEKGKEIFLTDELVQNWITHHLQIIGEAVNKLSNEFRLMYPDMPWKKIVGMRNILIHNYFEIDTAIVWAVVENDLPILKREILKLLETFKKEE